MNRTEKEIEKEVYCGILPVLGNERTYSFIDALLILSGYCIATWSYTQGAYLTGLVGFKQLLITAVAGALLMLMIYQLPVILSVRYGIDIWIWLRSAFGTKGVKAISVLIIVINFPWYAVCCDLFASSMINLAKLFSIPVPEWSHLALELFCVALGTFMACKGVKTITLTTRILVPALITVGALVIVVALRAVPAEAIWNYEPSELLMSKSAAYTLALEANFAFVITLVGGMAGVPRLCKSERSGYYAGVLGQGLAGSFFVVVGAVMAIAMQCKTGVASTDPTQMLATLASPAMALCSLLLVAFANIGTQAVGSYLYGVTLKSTFTNVSYRTLVIILGIYVSVLCIWGKIVEYFGTFLTVSACIYAPLAAILFVDFFFIRKQKLDFESAYELPEHNAYVYTKGYNLMGIICLAAGCIMSLAVYNPVSGEIYNKYLFALTPTGCALAGTGILYALLGKIPPIRRYLCRDISLYADWRPFDTRRFPPAQNILFTPFLWLAFFIITLPSKLKIVKSDKRGIKPPYLVLGTHHSFTDFYVTPLALFPHRANYVSELEGFEYYGEWVFRNLGCLGTRKFIADLPLVRNIKRVLDKGRILVLYPEARYANVGTHSKLPLSVARMVKLLGYPVVTLNMKGNYLLSPIWNLTKRKEVRLHTDMTYALTKEDIKEMSVDEIYEKLSKLLEYDEYRWQREQNMKITYEKRAEGLNLPLYQCRCCGKQFGMESKGIQLFCTNCNAVWEMDELGTLKGKDEAGDYYIPDWYEWERANVEKEISDGSYYLECEVQIDALPNAKNFIDCNNGILKHSAEGFTLTFTKPGKASEETLVFSDKTMLSVHTEYNYRGKGQCITLSTDDNTYFLFPRQEGFNATKIQFAVEAEKRKK